jgi:uncharacterized membrane protein
MENLFFIGLIFIILGIILIITAILHQKGEIKVGIGGFIGPVPFGFANEPEMMKLIIIVVAIVAIVFLIIMLRGFL